MASIIAPELKANFAVAVGSRAMIPLRTSSSRELNFLLVPFLSHQLPQQMKVNAADLMRQLLSRSAETTGYAFSLTTLKIHSMLVEGSLLLLDVDAGMKVD